MTQENETTRERYYKLSRDQSEQQFIAEVEKNLSLQKQIQELQARISELLGENDKLRTAQAAPAPAPAPATKK